MGSHFSQVARTKAELELEQSGRGYSAEVRSYEEACAVDSDVESFDRTLDQQADRCVSALISGFESQVLSLGSLKEITTCMLGLDTDVAKILLQHKEDILKEPDLFELADDFFTNSLSTLDLCSQIENCLLKAKGNQLMIQIALEQLPAEGDISESQMQKILRELRNFKNAENPFNEELLNHFKTVYESHLLMLDKLQAKKRKLDKKLKHKKVWRKLSNIIFGVIYATVVLCSVILAAIVKPAIAGALAALVPVFKVKKWALSSLKKIEDELKKQLDIVRTMHIETFIVLKELEAIERLVDGIAESISCIVRNVDFSLDHEDAIRIGMQEIRQQHESFVKEINELGTYIRRCSNKITKARTLVLMNIIRPDKNSSNS